MNRLPGTIACMLCGFILLHGCATPRPVLDLASHGVGVTTMAEAELERYLAAANDQLSARIVIVEQLSTAELEQRHGALFRDFVRAQTGDRSGVEIAALMRTLGEEHRRLREQLATESQKLSELHEQALGEEVRAHTAAFSTARNAFVPLAQELTPQEWLALTAHYARDILDTVKKIREEADAKKSMQDARGVQAGSGAENAGAAK